ncbi:XTP/dITP diphosphatase [Caldalkalibacillus salinus]|uniref:XTP/dITP diphosphatase n=1 Tax=Caldalkalibacillus salinus TaxID=2803787 RepID=UPI001923B34D|nr:XTP/dITP diphosphatase [Caldalkalibacillus salinus]
MKPSLQVEKLIVATSNQGKLKEIRALLEPLDIQVLSPVDIDAAHIPNVVEDGETFDDNALKKAKAFYNAFHIPALADDSGLEVDALDGAPGVYSARYAGEPSDDDANNEKLLQHLQGVPPEERNARFRCSIALVTAEDQYILAHGACEGYILEEKVGEAGFGYDPLFYVPEQGRSMAELSKEEKNKISHRYHALQHLYSKMNK